MTERNTLNVGTIEQKIIFLCEMQGQISDGQWENTRPYGHWKVWCKLQWDDVVVDPERIGRNFFAIKDNYNFASKFLLDIVGHRILTKINLYWILGEKFLELLKDDHWSIPDCKEGYDILKRHAEAGEVSSVARLKKLEACDVTEEILKTALNYDGGYTRNKMLWDIRDLRKACKKYRR